MKPTHEQITERAQEIWRQRACPEGRDEEIWLEAERQLTVAADAKMPESSGSANAPEGKRTAFSERVKAETAAESAVEYLISPAVSQQAAIEEAVELQQPKPAAKREERDTRGKNSERKR